MARPKKTAGKNIIKPNKNIIASNADKLRDRLLKSAKPGTKEIVMDFADVKSFDSVGLSTIIAACNTAENAGAKFSLINVSEELHRFFNTLRLNQEFKISMVE